MFRVLTFTLCVVLLYAVYLPAVHPPERFVEQIHVEHGLNIDFWGAQRAQHLLQRSLAWYSHQGELVPAAFAYSPTAASDRAAAGVSEHMGNVLERLLHNPYTRAFDALVLLATYRFSGVLNWLQWMAAFLLLACFDGYLVRLIRSKDFRAHSPLHFALCTLGATFALAFILVLLVVPVSVSPLLLGSVLLVLGTLIAIAISHFHR